MTFYCDIRADVKEGGNIRMCCVKSKIKDLGTTALAPFASAPCAMEDSQFPSSADGYTLVELIGKGMSNNEVWRALVSSRNNEEVAVKIIDLEEYSQENLESIRVRGTNNSQEIFPHRHTEAKTGHGIAFVTNFHLRMACTHSIDSYSDILYCRKKCKS